MAVRGRGHRGPAGHDRRAVPDQPPGRGRLPAGRLRRQGAGGRGPGAGRQGPGGQGPAACAGADRVRRAPRGPHLRRPGPAVLVRAAGAWRRPPPAAPRAAGRAGRPGGGRRRGHPHLHLGHHRAAQGGHADRGQHRLRHQGPRRRRRLLREPRPRRRHPVLPAAVPRGRADRHRVGERRRRHPGPLRRVDRHRPGQPARGPADPVLRRAPHLGEDPGHGRDPDGLGVAAEAGQLPAVDGPGGPDRGRAGGQRRHPHPLDPAALRPRLPVPVPVPAQAARPAALPLRRVGGGADRPRAAAVVLRARGGHPRDLRHDREQRRGHRQPPRPGPGSAPSASPTPGSSSASTRQPARS